MSRRCAVGRIVLVLVLLALSNSARAETIRDPHAHFSIEIDTTGLCIWVPHGHRNEPACRGFGSPTDLARLARADAPDQDLFAMKRDLGHHTLETLSVMRIESDDNETSRDDIDQFAALMFAGMSDGGVTKNASAVTTGEFRANGNQVVTFTQDFDLGGMATRVDGYLVAGKGSRYMISTMADVGSADDARGRILRAWQTLSVDRATPPTPAIVRLGGMAQRIVTIASVIIIAAWLSVRALTRRKAAADAVERPKKRRRKNRRT